MQDVLNIVELAPPIALMLALNVVGVAVKKSKLPDWCIPWALPIIGALVYPFIAVASPTLTQVKNPFVLNVIYGFLIGGAAVGGNQLLRQTVYAFGKKDANDTTPDQPAK